MPVTDLTIDADQFDGLPGGELLKQGIIDIGAGIESVQSLLVAIGYPRLVPLHLVDGLVPDQLPKTPELRLYRLLRETAPGAAYSEYNALIRTLVSFERALEHRHWRRLRAGK